MVKRRSGGERLGARGGLVGVLLLTLMCLSAVALVRPLTARADVTVQEGTQYSGAVSNVTCDAMSPMIDWGDGTPSSAGTTVIGPAATHVTGMHTYRLAGSYTGTVSYTCPQFSPTVQVQFTATVSDAPLTPTGIDFSGTVVTEVTATTAHVDDANPDSVSSDFTATIDWGDGSSSAGSVSDAAGGGYDIAGSHAYDEPGSYTVTTSVTDPGGGTSATSTATITGPHTPDTSIDSGPVGTINSATATFTFSSDTSGATFECSLDGATYAACTTPLTVGALSDGAHTFAVRAVASGRTDPTPATRAFTVDTGPPDTTIDSGPPATTDDHTPQFAFSSNRSDSTFECSLDGAPFTACVTPLTTETLADGSHQLAVRAVEGGQTDPTPATWDFTVQTPPDTIITSGPSGVIWTDGPTFTFISTIANSTFECRVDGSTWTACSSPRTLTVASGPHEFAVRAISPAHIVDPTPATRDFTVGATYTTDVQQCTRSIPQTPIDDPGPAPLSGKNPYVAYCDLRLGDCPQGARCTIAGDYLRNDQDADYPLRGWGKELGEALAFPTSSGTICDGPAQIVQAPPQLGSYPTHRCAVSFNGTFLGVPHDQTGDFATVGIISLDEGHVFCYGWQSEIATLVIGGRGAVFSGPDSQRYITCSGRMTVTPSTPVVPVVSQLGVAALAPFRGLLVFAGAIQGNAQQATVAGPGDPRSRPAPCTSGGRASSPSP